MPIYEYRCDKCGLEKEFLQKISDAPIAACPSCGSSMTKLISAAGFQLKGSGWYVTDFRNSGSKPASKDASKGDGKGATSGKSGGEDASGSAAPAAEKSTDGASGGDRKESAPAAPAVPTPTTGT